MTMLRWVELVVLHLCTAVMATMTHTKSTLVFLSVHLKRHFLPWFRKSFHVLSRDFICGVWSHPSVFNWQQRDGWSVSKETLIQTSAPPITCYNITTGVVND